jgi:hypothetical protein
MSDILDGPASRDASEPVFIMTASRSGSTLLRFILDSHPDLACPPETMIGSACGGMIRLWESLEHSSDAERVDIYDPPGVSAAGLVMIRAALDGAYESYLKRRGKKRWCDKSLDTPLFADTIQKIYPESKFICLVRHCMDVISSGVRNCPWGVARYGFDPYVAQYPGNSVAAIGAYWLATMQAILGFKEKNPDSCLVVRYEDLVTMPEETVDGILRFIGASPSAGITDACFGLPHEGRGPGDEKIWFTKRVSADSVGQGVSVPGMALPPDVRTSINEILARLGYKTVGEDWKATVGDFDPRADGPAVPAKPTVDDHVRDDLERTIRAIEDRLTTAHPDIASHWPSVAGVTVRLVAESLAGDCAELNWRFASGGKDTGAKGKPVIAATAATWMSLLHGETNMIAEILDGRMRCFNPNDTHRIRSDELHAIAALLGIATVPVEHTTTSIRR